MMQAETDPIRLVFGDGGMPILVRRPGRPDMPVDQFLDQLRAAGFAESALATALALRARVKQLEAQLVQLHERLPCLEAAAGVEAT